MRGNRNAAIKIAADTPPARKASSLRRISSLPSRSTTTNMTMPTIHPNAFCLYAFKRDQSLRERQRKDERRGRERQQEHVAVAEVPLARRTTLRRTTARRVSPRRLRRRTARARRRSSRFMPTRKSSCLPSLARPASFGSSAACTAWKRSSGTRATNRPVMKLRREILLVLACARARCTPRTLAYESSCASTDPRSSHASAPDSSEYGASGPGVMRPR